MKLRNSSFSQRYRPHVSGQLLPHATKKLRSRNINKLVLAQYILATLIIICAIIPFFLHFPEPEDITELRMLVGQCISPELSASWVLDASCVENPYLSTFSTTGHDRSCGLCGDKASYLREIRDKIEAEYKEKCKDLVVYGAALEKDPSTWMTETYNLGKNSFRSVQNHNTCFFQFVTDFSHYGTSDMLFSADYSQHLIVMDTEKMPYQNTRRNTELLKLNPGLFFPWADRVIWQDAKLLRQPSMPIDYMLHFNRTVQYHNTCSSFVGLPLHRSFVGKATDVTLKNHCDTMTSNALKTRASVSDDINVMFTQCNRYEEQFNNDDTESEKVFSQNPLVDTAFIVYDMRTENCRKFNNDFGCSWLDEVHCYSDRDQISFPVVLSSSGLKLSSDISTDGLEYRDRVYVDVTKVPMLHIAKRSCHWYFKSFSRCIAPEVGNSDEISFEHESDVILLADTKVAVVVAGSIQRFMFESTRKSVLQYFGEKEISMDFYVSLETTQTKAYRFPFGQSLSSAFDDNADIEEFMRSEIGRSSSTGTIQIQDRINIDNEPLLKARRAKALIDNPNEDPDLRFPLFNVQSEKIGFRTANTNRNLLRTYLTIQKLWEKVLKWEREEHFKYDYVLFLRDDTFWSDSLQLFDKHVEEDDVFIPACDTSKSTVDGAEINDHILISKRNVADIFGNYYNNLFNANIEGCMGRLSDKLRADRRRGCSSEMLLKWVTDAREVKMCKRTNW
eukprot:CAMPEP_0178952834 /NCGR_PEP_ID=MMETSP0789-20121207/8074_1 /TAXON_ID=3005 /ORGANISM="Rhizosolenia setigera, Strain CCMP 1694" /LENGTH=730 /DNA_ID=CAMNT_0020634007 /DNA_START=115 /DNA_END=2304 /DNA_ORIENTATION=-